MPRVRAAPAPPVDVRFSPAFGRFTQEDVDRIGPVIYRLALQNGGVRPAELLEAARDPASPVHAYIPWDDARAAERYRLLVAKKLLKAVNIVFTVNRHGRPQETVVRAVHFVRVPVVDQSAAEAVSEEADPEVSRPRRQRVTPTRNAYVAFTTVVQSEDLRRQVLDAARADMDRAVAKFRQLDGHLPDFAARYPRLRAAVDEAIAAFVAE